MTSSPPTATREGILVIGAGELGSSVLDALSRRSDRDADLRTLTLAVRRATTDRAMPHRPDEEVPRGLRTGKGRLVAKEVLP